MAAPRNPGGPPRPGRKSQQHAGWKPTTKAEEHMAPMYRGMSRSRRMEIAVQRVVEEGNSQAEAARECGISRPRLNEKVQVAMAARNAQRDRGELAMAEKVALLQEAVPVLRVENEVRRVPDFEEFDRIYFGNLVCPDCGVHHETPDFHKEIMRFTTDPKQLWQLVNLPPYHSKSTIITVKRTVWRLCQNPNYRAAIVTKSQRFSQRFVYAISQYLEIPELYNGAERNLVDDWGPFRGMGEWNKTQIYVAGRTSAEKEPNVAAYGVGGHIYGTRWDEMIFDDIADLENQKNPELVTEQIRWCTQEAGSRVGRTGRLLFVGTRVGAHDIYSFLDDLPGFSVLRYSCILDEEGQTTLWPEHFPYEYAIRKRDTMTPEAWQLVYQNVDVPGMGADFPPEVVESCYDHERILGAIDSRWALVAGLDPAGSGKQAGSTALILLAIDLLTGQRFLVDLVNVRSMKAPQLKDQIFAWADAYPQLREFRVEVNGLQGQLTQYNEQLLQHLTNRGVRVVPHITTGHNKWDPEFGVQSMAPMFYNRQISLPVGNQQTRAKVQQLVDQLIQFPMGTSDLVMALWFAELAARDLFKRTTLPMFDDRKRLPAHIRARRRVIDFNQRTVRSPAQAQYGHRPVGILDPVGVEHQLVNMLGTVTVRG